MRGRLALVLVADRGFGRGLLRRQMRVDRHAHRGQPRTVLTQPVQQLHDERRPGGGRERTAHRAVVMFQFGDQGIGGNTFQPRRRDRVGEAAQVLDQRQLEHARPGPELADRERRHALEAFDERGQLVPREPAVAVAQQLDGHRIDARLAHVFRRREARQFAVVGAGQVPADVLDFRRHQVEVVEQPLGRWGDEDAGPYVMRQRTIALAQHAGVFFEPGKDAAGAAARIDGKAGCYRQGTFFEALNAEQLIAERLGWRRRTGGPQPAKDVKHKATSGKASIGRGSGRGPWQT